MKKILLLVLFGLVLGGCKPDEFNEFNDSPPMPSSYILSYIITNDDGANVFPKSIRDTSYIGHPLDPTTFKAFNHHGKAIHELGFINGLGITFTMYDLRINYGLNWGQSAGDTIVQWLLCFGNDCDTLTMGVHTVDELRALQLPHNPQGQKWVVWQNDTLYNLKSQQLASFKSWIP